MGRTPEELLGTRRPGAGPPRRPATGRRPGRSSCSTGRGESVEHERRLLRTPTARSVWVTSATTLERDADGRAAAPSSRSALDISERKRGRGGAAPQRGPLPQAHRRGPGRPGAEQARRHPGRGQPGLPRHDGRPGRPSCWPRDAAGPAPPRRLPRTTTARSAGWCAGEIDTHRARAAPGAPRRQGGVGERRHHACCGRAARSFLHAVTEDITDRKLAAEALTESENRFRTLTESLPMGIYQAEHRGRGHLHEPAVGEVTGLGVRRPRPGPTPWLRSTPTTRSGWAGACWACCATAGPTTTATGSSPRPASMRWLSNRATADARRARGHHRHHRLARGRHRAGGRPGAEHPPGRDRRDDQRPGGHHRRRHRQARLPEPLGPRGVRAGRPRHHHVVGRVHVLAATRPS